jgi:endonuclease/exonuclease/phosphatase (EEP) superfamily protein YafD
MVEKSESLEITHVDSFTVMTTNVGNNRAPAEKLIPVIRDSGADLVAFQEVSDQQADAIKTDLVTAYPYQAVYPGNFAGKALLSRYPILDSKQLHLSEERPDLKTVVDIGGTEITLIIAHPPPPRPHWRGLKFDRQTWKQITSLAELAIHHKPVVLLGDFNLAEWWGEYAYLRKMGLKDAFQVAGRDRGHTLPRRIGPWKRMQALNRLLSRLTFIPLLRVDYIWYTEPLHCLESWVGNDNGSDHLPVLAKLVLSD